MASCMGDCIIRCFPLSQVKIAAAAACLVLGVAAELPEAPAFASLDANGDGVITDAEVRAVQAGRRQVCVLFVSTIDQPIERITSQALDCR